MLDVVTIGEGLVLFTPQNPGRMRHSSMFRRTFAGAESNVAVGLARLGLWAGWVSRVGDDEFGAYLVSSIRGENVDVSQVAVDAEAPTGIYFKEFRRRGETHVWYYRRGSAASKMAPGHVNWDYVRSAKVLHLTGIFPALGESCAETAVRAVTEAKAAGMIVSFDPNFRSKLWSAADAKRFMLQILSKVDILLPGIDEAELLVGPGSPETLCERLRDLGPELIALKQGAQGATVLGPAGVCKAAAPHVEVVDTIGAGDAFVAAFLACYLKDFPLDETLRHAVAAGALATTVSGDIEGLPTWRELTAFANQPAMSGDVR